MAQFAKIYHRQARNLQGDRESTKDAGPAAGEQLRDICYRRSDALENNYREIRESVGHTSRRDHKLIQQPEDMHNLYTWRAIRDSKDGDPAINLSNSTASMMGWLCNRTAKAHPNSTVAKLMAS